MAIPIANPFRGGSGLVPWAAVAAWTALWAWLQSNPSGLSWHFFVSGSTLLFHGSGLNVYAEHPELQIGPLAFVAAAPRVGRPAVGRGARLGVCGDGAQPAALLLMTAAGLACLYLIAPLVSPPHRQ